MSRIGGKPVWADVGPDFDEGDPRNPNDSVFSLVYLAEDYEACAKASYEWMERALKAESALEGADRLTNAAWARLAEAEALLREARDDVVEASNHTHKPHAVAYYKEKIASIDAFLAREQP